MPSILEGLAPARAIPRGVPIRVVVLTFLGLLPQVLSAQGGVALGVRGGAGVDRFGDTAYSGQVEITEFVGSHSVQVAVNGFSGRALDRYQAVRSSIVHQYREETRVSGGGILGSVLFRHSRGAGGPYLAVGLGVAAMWVDWRIESPTDNRMPNPLPTGGGFEAEDDMTLGSMVNLGVGQRLHEHLDLRAQMLTLIVPSSDRREDLKVIPSFTLTTGISF